LEITIAQERPDSAEARALIDELQSSLAPLYPPASQHGLSVDMLIAQKVPFFVLRCDGEPAACGGVRIYGQEYGEIKRMYVRPGYRGQGLAKFVLKHLEAYSLQQGITLLRLETGIYQAEAIGLYERLGYRSIPPFGEYQEDPLSLFYEKELKDK
jgi:putative acetyltransferase